MSGQDGTPEGGRGQALLIQHRELISIIGRVECSLSSSISSAADLNAAADPVVADHAMAHELTRLLQSLIRGLETHFDAERESLKSDFDDAPEMRAAFRRLDKDHPKILVEFGAALEALRREALWSEVASLTRHAISSFLDHEEQEDALFAAHI